ncbi:MAG: UDP-N-acetylmuramoyl-L-alanyl-D-glutamate--2,6-diaminopimelate ligase [Campylobacterales bacterium]|nr:UDP-N-acetylmuramoyl-L-alanyl-D-glutamate--2,6-diaminopimelate ligase [Campylobacterales bacterium]
MKIPVTHPQFSHISDSSLACDASTAFVRTAQNTQYEVDAKAHGAPAILTPAMCHALLGISPELKVVGITGTNGKTTTAAAMYSFLLDLHVKVALQGTRGCMINETLFESRSLTTPPILQTLWHMAEASKAGCRYFIMEVSSHAIVQERIESLSFALRIFTNLSQDHLDFHGSMEAYAAAKSAFFDTEGMKLINRDQRGLRYNPTNAVTYGVESPADFSVKAYGLQQGIRAVVAYKQETFHMESSLQGNFNLYNLLAALAGVFLLESPTSVALCEAIEGFGGVSGRMEVVHEDPLVIVDFAHTPDGMEKVLDAMKHHQLVVVFGAGGNRDATKRPVMGKIAKRFAKRLIVTSDNPRFEDPATIITQILEGVCGDVVVEVDRRTAIETALASLQEGEALMILGKGDEEYQDIAGVKYPYDDRVVVREWFSAQKH